MPQLGRRRSCPGKLLVGYRRIWVGLPLDVDFTRRLPLVLSQADVLI